MLVTYGPVIGQASGRLGASVASHNKGGTYWRLGSIPITVTTPAALFAKAVLAASSGLFRTLTAPQLLSWQTFAATNPVTNRLGKQITLSPIAAFNQINSRLLHAGETAILTPPIDPAPNPLISLVQSADIGSGTFDLAFTATPLGASEELWITCAVVDSPGIVHVENLLRLIGHSDPAQASPFDHQALVEARFGTLVVGQSVHVKAQVFDNLTGLVSAPLRDSDVVTDTP